MHFITETKCTLCALAINGSEWILRKRFRDRGEKEKYYIRINLILSNQIKKNSINNA